MDDPDLPLVRALQAGDDHALTALMARHREPLYRFLFRYTRNETAAADLAQEAFVRAYFNIGSFKPAARFSTWLHQIALNLCRDRARSRDYKRSFWQQPLSDLAGALTITDRTPSPEALAITRESGEHLQRLIDELPHPLKAVLILTVLEERPHKEVAEILGISPKAVETRVYRARKLLAASLANPRKT
jgi:RNA polymerase sigma-70 factor (ECF subfamily)